MLTTTKPSAPAADRALSILELLCASNHGLSLTEIGRRTTIPLASCSAIMHTLKRRGYASEEIIGRTHLWSATLAIARLGTMRMSQIGLADIAQPHLERLANEVRVHAHLGVLEGDQVIYVAKAAYPSFVQFHTYVGRTVEFSTTALGKAIVAFMPEARRATFLQQEHVASPSPLFADIANCSKRGYAIEDGEEYEGIACLAAPVFGAAGEVIAAVSVTAFRDEILSARKTAVVAALRETAKAIEHDLGSP